MDQREPDLRGRRIIGVIGHTGSGKSTLIQHFNGLLKPTAGKITLTGRTSGRIRASSGLCAFNVGLVFQYPEYQLFEETVYKDIAFGPKNMGLSEEEIDKRVREAAEFVGLRAELLEKAPLSCPAAEPGGHR